MTDPFEGLTHRGAQVVLDGPDGSGKSTAALKLADFTNSYLTREPGGTEIGSRIRRFLLDVDTVGILPETEVFLFSADRHQLQQEIVMPALASGISVVGDRSYESTIAYQCYGRGVDVNYVLQATDLALGVHRPDMHLILDVPFEVGLQRMPLRAALDRVELEDQAFHERVRNGFLERAALDPGRYTVIDATGTPDEVFEQVFAACGQLLLEGVNLYG